MCSGWPRSYPLLSANSFRCFEWRLNRWQTAPRSIGGTVGFMAPEVANGTTGPTPAADIYALGILLWVLVTGLPPRQPLDFAATIERPDLEPIVAIVRDCTHSEPSRRFATTEALNAAIQDRVVAGL